MIFKPCIQNRSAAAVSLVNQPTVQIELRLISVDVIPILNLSVSLAYTPLESPSYIEERTSLNRTLLGRMCIFLGLWTVTQFLKSFQCCIFRLSRARKIQTTIGVIRINPKGKNGFWEINASKYTNENMSVVRHDISLSCMLIHGECSCD